MRSRDLGGAHAPTAPPLATPMVTMCAVRGFVSPVSSTACSFCTQLNQNVDFIDQFSKLAN